MSTCVVNHFLCWNDNFNMWTVYSSNSAFEIRPETVLFHAQYRKLDLLAWYCPLLTCANNSILHETWCELSIASVYNDFQWACELFMKHWHHTNLPYQPFLNEEKKTLIQFSYHNMTTSITPIYAVISTRRKKYPLCCKRRRSDTSTTQELVSISILLSFNSSMIYLVWHKYISRNTVYKTFNLLLEWTSHVFVFSIYSMNQ